MQKAAQEDSPFMQRRSSISIEKLRRSSLSHAGNFNYIKIKKNEFLPGTLAPAGASMGGGRTRCLPLEVSAEQQIPQIFVLIITNPSKGACGAAPEG